VPNRLRSSMIAFLSAALVVCAFAMPHSAFQTDTLYDVVISNGRVIDPESGLDAIRDIGITGGTIRAVSARRLKGHTTVLATGMVVCPGFIDLHVHGMIQENHRYEAMDGVTTALELEAGTNDIDRFYSDRQGRNLINYGASIGHMPVRMQVMRDRGPGLVPSGDAAHRQATDAEIEQMKGLIETGLKKGALAVGFGINYTAAASRWEILELFRVASRYGAPCSVHMRYAGAKEPENSIAALEEVLSAALVTGAPLHVVHITSMGLRVTPRLLAMIAEARKRGIDVTTECYPYTAGMTGIEAAIFDEGWRDRLEIDYNDLQWAQTGERLTADSFTRFRKTGGMIAIHMIPEEIVRLGVASPLTMIASDGILQNGKGHPRASGTYCRVLGRYVREQKLLSLNDAIRKMTLMPAQRLESRAPMMRNKGRIRPGADADIVVFDPEKVIDRSTYESPAQYSEGMKFVLVNGTFVVRDGALQTGVTPGRAVRAPETK